MESNVPEGGQGAHAQIIALRPNRFVIVAAVVSALGGLLFGFDTGVISGALLYIKPEFHLSATGQQAVVSALLLAAIAGALSGGPLSDGAGRRRTLTSAAILFVVGALVAATAQAFWWLIVGRILLGLAIGAASQVVPVYIAEISPPRFRGALVSLQQLMITVGILLSYLVDYAFSGFGGWRWMLGAGVVPGVALFVGMLFLPESPRWFLAEGRREEALSVLRRSRPVGTDVGAEADEIERVRKAEARYSYRDLLAPAVRPALLIGVGIAFFNQLSGVNAVIYYAPTIIHDAGFGSSASILATTGIGLVNTSVTIAALFLIDRVGRRPLLFTGMSIVLLALIGLGVAYLLPGGSSLSNYLLLGGLLVYIAAFAFSLGIAIWLLNSEIYPLEVRGKGAAAGAMTHWVFDFIIASTVLYLFNSITPTGTFWLYGAFVVVGIIFLWRRLPETKGRTLEEVSEDLAKRASVSQTPQEVVSSTIEGEEQESPERRG